MRDFIHNIGVQVLCFSLYDKHICNINDSDDQLGIMRNLIHKVRYSDYTPLIVRALMAVS